MLHAEQLIEAALKLSHDERAKVVEGESLGDEWEGVIARRVAELDSGKVQPIPGDVVFKKLGQRFGDK